MPLRVCLSGAAEGAAAHGVMCLCVRPKNGSIVLYNRKKVKYRKDGYCWKKRKDGKTTREDHMKLKVQGMEVREAPPRSNWAPAL